MGNLSEEYFISFPVVGKIPEHSDYKIYFMITTKKKKQSKKDGNNTQVFSYKTLLLHTSHVLLAVFQQPTAFFPNKTFASPLNTFHSKTKSPMTLDDLLQGTNYVNNNTLQL